MKKQNDVKTGKGEGKMKLTYHGHSVVKMETNGKRFSLIRLLRATQ